MSKIVANNISPRSGDTVAFSGNISVGGTVTYEDVTNVDSVGVITARSGLIVQGSGIGLSVTEGGARVTGVVTATTFSGAHTGDGTSLTLDTQDLTIRSWLFTG